MPKKAQARRKRCSVCEQLRDPATLDDQKRCHTCRKKIKNVQQTFDIQPKSSRDAVATRMAKDLATAEQVASVVPVPGSPLDKALEAAKQPTPFVSAKDKPKPTSTKPSPTLLSTKVTGTTSSTPTSSTATATNLLSQRIKQEKEVDTNVLPPHVIVEARAGTGKTTTLIEGLKRVKGIESNLTPSPQQAAVWEQMELSRDAKTVCFVAFNKAIAEELKRRVPQGCEASTMHSLGFKAVGKAFSGLRVNSYRVQDIISELLERDIRELRRSKPIVIKAVEELVGLCKMNLVDGGIDALSDLASYYDVDLNGNSQEVFDLVPRVLERCKQVDQDKCLDFNDMIWLPVALNLPVYQYDLLLVDEAQDLNKCQQQLARRAGKRLIFCGDPKQSIYGFAGADCESMNRLEKELGATEQGCVHLPLTVTRRCGKAIVKEAQKYVPDFEAFETNPEGSISRMKIKPDQSQKTSDGKLPEAAQSYQGVVQTGDMILCRCNAPLVSECFRFIRAGRRADIQGRDVGQGLVNTIKKMKSCRGLEERQFSGVPVTRLISDLDDWLHSEMNKENAKRNPSDSRLINLQDKRDCLGCFCDMESTVGGVMQRITAVFTDDKNGSGIRLSSVHKAKGLESKRVFILMPKEAPMPHPMAKTAWEKEQEINILYVAITRAIEELIYVS